MLLKYNDVVYHDDDHDQMLELADDVLTDLKNNVLVSHWNDWCEKNYYDEDHIYSMNELDEYLTMINVSAYDVIVGNVVNFDCFSHMEDYFKDGIYGLTSSDSPWDLVDFDDYPDFIDYMVDLIKFDPYKFDVEEVYEDDEEDTEEQVTARLPLGITLGVNRKFPIIIT